MYVCMDCSFSFGMPLSFRKTIDDLIPGVNNGGLPSGKRVCPKCTSKTVRTNAELNLEMDEVMRGYLKRKYPNFTFRPVYKQETGS